MPRKKKARRFEPRYGASQSTLDLEAGYLQREVQNYAVFASADVAKTLSERHANCQNTWKHVSLVLESAPQRDRQILQALLFRDLWLVLELYRTYLTPQAKTMPPASKSPPESLPFSQFLFDL